METGNLGRGGKLRISFFILVAIMRLDEYRIMNRIIIQKVA